jgi:polysaccharide biosynthesis protein PslH
MHILIITASFPYPPASGGAIRVYGIIQGLKAAGHRLTLLSFHDRKTQPQATPLWAICDEVITVRPPDRTRGNRVRDLLLSRQPDIARRLYSPEFEAKLRELLQTQKFDLIQIEAIEVAAYIPVVKEVQPSAKIIFDTFNAEYVLQRVIFDIDRRELKRLPLALYSFIQAGRIKRFEGRMCRLADAVIAVSTEDADALRDFREDKRVFIVPSGLSVDDYKTPVTRIDLGRHALVFTGKMDYRPNVDAMLWFAESILPKIQAQIRDVSLIIVGQQPHPRLNALRQNPAITLTGWVEAVQPYLQSSAVYIAPLRMGSGTRLKLLEAMASKCAIVATTTAAAGLLHEAKATMRIADSEEAFAQNVIELLRNQDVRRQLGEAAYQSVCKHYDWSMLIPHLLTVYKDVRLE